MNDIYLIRHSLKMRGPVTGDFSAFDLMQPLSAAGEDRARMLLDMPELRGAGFAAASNMSRSLATIRYILEADNVPYIVDERLRELGFGIKPQGMPMDEFMETHTLRKLSKYAGDLDALNLDGFYNPLKALLDHFVETGMLEPRDRALVKFPETVEELLEYFEGD